MEGADILSACLIRCLWCCCSVMVCCHIALGWLAVAVSSAVELLRLHRWHKHKQELAEVLIAVKRIPGEAILKVSTAYSVSKSINIKCNWTCSRNLAIVFMK